MRFLKTLACIGLIGAFSEAVTLQAQDSFLGGPSLGFTPADAGNAIRPIIGIPGASVLSDRLEFATSISGVVISPKQDYALAARAENGQLVVIDLRSSPPFINPLDGTRVEADIIATSPTGSTAAIYDQQTKTIQIIGHLPAAPEWMRSLDSSRIANSVTGLAVSDDGSVVLVRFADTNDPLWIMDSSGAAWPVSVGRPSAIAFFPNSTDAVVADDVTHTALLLLDVAHAASQVPLLSAEDGLPDISAVSISDDGRRVFLADSESGTIAVVDMETRRPSLLSCGCRPTGLYSLKGRSIFRLTETVSHEPTIVFDASTAKPRFVIVPPSAPAEVEAQ